MSDPISRIKSSGGDVDAIVADGLSILNEMEIDAMRRVLSERIGTVSLLDSSDTHRAAAYVYYNSGALMTSGTTADYNVYVIPVISGGKLYMTGAQSASNVHIAFAEYMPDIMGMHVGDTIPGYISGVVNDTTYNGDGFYEFDVPEGARFATVSTPLNVGNSFTLSNRFRGAYGFKRSYFDEYLDDKLSDVVVGNTTKNLFTDRNSVDGKFLYYKSGVVNDNAEYKACAIRVSPGQVLSFNNGFSVSHVVFISEYVPCIGDIDLSVGDTLGTFVDGFTGEAKQGYVVPDGAHMMVASVPKSRLNSLQIEIGESSTEFVPHLTIPESMVPGAIGRTLTVGAGMEFSTISEAVQSARDGDEIVVYPGVYDEAVKAWGKNICIRGVSKRDCILTHSAEDYSNPPLEMSHGRLECITIIGTTGGTPGDMPAYCMHVEDNSAEGSSFFVKDVEFINERHACVGIGLRNNYVLEFNGCSFIATGNNIAFYCHDHETSVTGEDSQTLILDSCVIDAKTNYTITLQSQEIEGNRATLKAMRNVVVNRSSSDNLINMIKWNNRDVGVDNFMGAYSWVLDATSGLNTLDTLNHQDA